MRRPRLHCRMPNSSHHMPSYISLAELPLGSGDGQPMNENWISNGFSFEKVSEQSISIHFRISIFHQWLPCSVATLQLHIISKWQINLGAALYFDNTLTFFFPVSCRFIFNKPWVFLLYFHSWYFIVHKYYQCVNLTTDYKNVLDVTFLNRRCFRGIKFTKTIW